MWNKEVELYTSEENILNSLTDGIIVIDAEGEVRNWNLAVERLLGISKDKAIGRDIHEICQQSQENRIFAAISELLSKEKYLNEKEVVEIEQIREDNNLSCQIRLSSLKDKTEKVRGIIIIITDISGKVRLEKKLLQSERLASIGKLSANLAHELNNPLDGIIRYTNLSLEFAEKNCVLREYLLNVKEGLQRIVKIIRSLLEFSRQTAIPPIRFVSVQEAIEEAFSLLPPQIKNCSVEIKKDYQANLPLVLDGGLYIAFSNIIKNAYEAMPKGGRLKISTGVRNNFVEINISDTGCGIPEDIQKNIFDPFFSTKELGKGTGLGLTICREIIERCEGAIVVNSNVGRGTTFTIHLPIYLKNTKRMHFSGR